MSADVRWNTLYRGTAIVCLVATIAILIWDVVLSISDKTISATTLFMSQHGHFAVPFMVGSLCGHLFTAWKKPSRNLVWLFAIISLTVIALDVYCGVKGISNGVIVLFNKAPLIPFFLGIPNGFLFQQKSKE